MVHLPSLPPLGVPVVRFLVFSPVCKPVLYEVSLTQAFPSPPALQRFWHPLRRRACSVRFPPGAVGGPPFLLICERWEGMKTS